MDIHPHLNIAISAARLAGKVILRNLDKLDRIQIQTKGLNDFVSSVDIKAQQVIIDTILKAYPKHQILAEEAMEHAGEGNKEPIKWIIDPLDGTLNFIHGLPHFAVSIAIEYKGVIEHAVILDPITDELFSASKGSGAKLNDRRMRVSNCQHLQSSLLATNHMLQHLLKFKDIFKQCCSVRSTGAAALDLAYVAAGRLDGMIGSDLKPWDLAAGSLLIREAGGFISDFQGEKDYLSNGNIIAGSRKTYMAILEKLL